MARNKFIQKLGIDVSDVEEDFFRNGYTHKQIEDKYRLTTSQARLLLDEIVNNRMNPPEPDPAKKLRTFILPDVKNDLLNLYYNNNISGYDLKRYGI